MGNTSDRPLTSGSQNDGAKKQEMPAKPKDQPEIKHQGDKPELARKPDSGTEPAGNKDQQL